MKRKHALIMKILEHVEAQEDELAFSVPDFDGYSEAEVHRHIGLCRDADYLVTSQPSSANGRVRYRRIWRLTWNGYDALDQYRRNMRGE